MEQWPQSGWWVRLGDPDELIGVVTADKPASLKHTVCGGDTDTITQFQKEEVLLGLVDLIEQHFKSNKETWSTDWWDDLQKCVSNHIRARYERDGTEIDRPVVLNSKIFEVKTYWM